MATPDDRKLNPILDKIFKEAINLQQAKKQEANQIMEDFLRKQLIKEMKASSDVFSDIYRNLFYTGSYYDGLKIGQPDEFDINVVLKLPKSLDMKVEKGRPGYAYYYTEKNPDSIGPVKALFPKDDGNSRFYLVPEDIMSWFQGILAKILNGVRVTRSGPAWTIHLEDKNIDIDLVPVFYFNDDDGDEIFLVPKPPNHYASVNRKYLWRLSYAAKEKKLLKELNSVEQSCFKKLTKLLKYFRDQQGAPLKQFCSYFIKTFMLLQRRDNAAINWKDERQLGCYFRLLLNELHKILESKNMPSYFDDNFNILESINERKKQGSASALENITGYFRHVLRKVNGDPLRYIPEIFGYKEKQEEEIEEITSALCKYNIEDRSARRKPEYQDYEDDARRETTLVFNGQSVQQYSTRRKEADENEGFSTEAKVAMVLGAGLFAIGLGYLAYDAWNKEERREDRRESRR